MRGIAYRDVFHSRVHEKRMYSSYAFSLKITRLLIVTTFVAVVFLSACGVRWRLRMSGAEGSLRKIEKSEKIYKAKNGRYGTLQELAATGLVTGNLSKGVGDGYRYDVRVKDDSYEARAVPDKSVDEKLPAYLLDQSGVMHMSELEATEANVNDPSPSEK